MTCWHGATRQKSESDDGRRANMSVASRTHLALQRCHVDLAGGARSHSSSSQQHAQHCCHTGKPCDHFRLFAGARAIERTPGLVRWRNLAPGDLYSVDQYTVQY